MAVNRRPSTCSRATSATDGNFRAAAEAALRGAKPMHDNAFKVELAKRTLVRSLQTATEASQES